MDFTKDANFHLTGRSRCTRASAHSQSSSNSHVTGDPPICPTTSNSIPDLPGPDIPIPPSRKTCRARRSLKFDNLDKSDSKTNQHDEIDIECENMNSKDCDGETSQRSHRSPSPRRSKRLISKCQPSTSSASEFNTSFIIHEESNDSGMVGAGSQPNSQDSGIEIGFSHRKTAFDALSVSSDYGTSSEHSFNSSFTSSSFSFLQTSKRVYPTRLRKKRKLEEESKKQKALGRPEDLSPGYVSDIDDLREPPSPQGWDDDVDFRCPRGIGIPGEWDRAILQEGFQFDEIRSQVKVQLVSRNGIHLIAPTEPNCTIPPNWIPKEPPQNNNNPFSHLIQLPEPSSRRKRKLNCGMKIPPIPPSPFQIHTHPADEVEQSFLRHGLRVIPASPLISPQPFGTRFNQSSPAIISIPLNQVPSQLDDIYCLYSDSQPSSLNHDDPFLNWKVLNDININLTDGRLTFETLEFGTFFIVIREGPIESHKHIRTRTGGKLIVPEVPWIEVNFPKGSVTTDLTARAKVFFDTEKSLPEVFSEAQILQRHDTISLASPIIMLEPNGISFGNERVTIRLPIPDYDEIKNYFGEHIKLLILQSCTSEYEPSDWKLLETPYKIFKLKSMHVIEFEVSHFTFFRVVWDLISASLYETKVGMSNYFSFVSFSMKCQANMSNQADDNRFGLEVTCFRSDKKYPEPSNYRFKVGGSTKPKMVRPGKIFVRLKSQYFCADEEAGEDPSLVKEETDFRGRDFEMQYCCKFNDLEKPIETGTFGKVIVKRATKAGQEEPLFEFNLQKSGHEGEKTPYCGDQNDRWSIVALQELAANMFITDGDNWKLFASAIGFNKNEIKHMLKPTEDPFLTMINVFQHRGGTPDEFVRGIYSVHRELKLQASSPASSRKSKASNSSSGRGSLPHNDKYGRRVISSDSDTSGTQISQDSLLNGSRKRSSNNNSISKGSGEGSSSKKFKKRKAIPRKDSSDTDENGNISSPSPPRSDRGSESDSDVERDIKSRARKSKHFESAQSTSMSSIVYRNDQSKLDQKYLWEISAYIDSIAWRPLGRSLGLEESKLINIENTYRNNGFRECAYQTLIAWKERYPKTCVFSNLYQALQKERLTSVAKKMHTLIPDYLGSQSQN